MSAKRPSRRKIGRRAGFLGDAHHVAQLDHRLVAGQRVGRHRRRGQRLAPGQIALGQPHRDLDRIAALAAMRIADGDAAEQRLRSCRRRRAARRRRTRAGPGRWRCAGAGAARRSESSTSTMKGTEAKIFFTSRATARRVVEIRAIDLGEQRRQHRRPRRHLDHLERRCRPASAALSSAARRSSAIAWLERLALAFAARD